MNTIFFEDVFLFKKAYEIHSFKRINKLAQTFIIN
jgi:hypothetical protein